jgi:hypothetical protein
MNTTTPTNHALQHRRRVVAVAIGASRGCRRPLDDAPLARTASG